MLRILALPGGGQFMAGLVSAALVLTLVSGQQPFRVVGPSSNPIRDAIARSASIVTLNRTVAVPASGPHAKRAANIKGGAIGGAVGFFAGMFIGYAIDRAHGCACDDPGLAGLVIGAPVGAVAGAVFGTWVASR